MVEDAIADRFVEMIVEHARKLKVGNGLDADVDVGPVVDEQQLKTVLRYLEIGKKEARLLHGGGRMAGSAYENGYFVARRCSITFRGTARSLRKRFSDPCFP